MCGGSQRRTETSFNSTFTENGGTAENREVSCLTRGREKSSKRKSCINKIGVLNENRFGVKRKRTFTYSPLLSVKSCWLKNKRKSWEVYINKDWGDLLYMHASSYFLYIMEHWGRKPFKHHWSLGLPDPPYAQTHTSCMYEAIFGSQQLCLSKCI